MLSAFHVAALAELLVVIGAVQLRSVGNDKHSGSEEYFAYDYSKHGQDWIQGSCASRSRQSPIDLPAYAPVTGFFSYKYDAIVSPVELHNNGHTLSMDVAGGGYGGVTYENAWYTLMNINVHSLSEHSWTGVQMPLELHLVHKRYDGEQLLIIALAIESPNLTGPKMQAMMNMQGKLPASLFQQNVSEISNNLRKAAKQAPPTMYEAGATYVEPPANKPGFNPALQAFLKMPPPAPNMKVMVPADNAHFFDLNPLLAGKAFYEYAGSLTAPPCAEIATWLVKQETVKASDDQVMWLHDAIYKTTADFGNFRSLMPLNGRVVTARQPIFQDSLGTPVPSIQTSPQELSRGDKAMTWAMDAMTIAKSATDYVKDLDSRLRRAAQAHAMAMEPELDTFTINGQVATPSGAVFAPTSPLGNAGSLQYPGQMEKTAQTMARNLATAARHEVQDSTRQISHQSKQVAMKAAKDAANIVLSGSDDTTAMAHAAYGIGTANAAGLLPPPTAAGLPPPAVTR